MRLMCGNSVYSCTTKQQQTSTRHSSEKVIEEQKEWDNRNQLGERRVECFSLNTPSLQIDICTQRQNMTRQRERKAKRRVCHGWTTDLRSVSPNCFILWNQTLLQLTQSVLSGVVPLDQSHMCVWQMGQPKKSRACFFCACITWSRMQSLTCATFIRHFIQWTNMLKDYSHNYAHNFASVSGYKRVQASTILTLAEAWDIICFSHVRIKRWREEAR